MHGSEGAPRIGALIGMGVRNPLAGWAGASEQFTNRVGNVSIFKKNHSPSFRARGRSSSLNPDEYASIKGIGNTYV